MAEKTRFSKSQDLQSLHDPNQYLTTPPDDKFDLQLTPPGSDERQRPSGVCGVQRMLSVIRRQSEAGNDAPLTDFKIRKRRYDQSGEILERPLPRFDYDPETGDLTLRMPSPVHNFFSTSFANEVRDRLNNIKDGGGSDPAPISREQLPPTTDGIYHDFNNMDAAPVQDKANNQLPKDAIDSLDMMGLLNDPLIASAIDPFTQPMGNMAGSSLVPPIPPPLAPRLSQQTMGLPMAPAIRPAPLAAPQPAAPSISQEPPTQDGSVNQHNLAQSGTSGGASGSSADFTKGQNWPGKVIETLKDLLQVLDDHGRIKYVSSSVTALAGYQQSEIANLYFKDLLHPDDAGLFVAEMNGSVASGEPMRMFYRLKTKDGTYSIFEAVGHAHAAPPHSALEPTNPVPFCQAFFLISRPYPTRNAGLLDTFLEYKVESERLSRRIANLWLEVTEEAAAAQRGSKSKAPPPDDLRRRRSSTAGAVVDKATTPPHRPANSGGTPTRENLEGAAQGRPNPLQDKMAGYERESRVGTIELLTGLRHVDGERGHGTTSGRTSTKLITGDAGITITAGRESRPGEKKRKQRVVGEYVCTGCGILESPEWRRGPNGPKTLCNACGLRWAKKRRGGW